MAIDLHSFSSLLDRLVLFFESQPITMKAALALVFFACVAGSMATSTPAELVGQLVQQGQAVAQGVLGQLQQQVLSLVQQAFGQASSLVGSIGGRFDFDSLVGQFTPLVNGLINQALSQVLGSLSGLIGGKCSICSFV
jgi:hypothetical protein